MNNGFLDELFETPENNAYLDGDTIRDTQTGQSMRLNGIDTPEVAHVTPEGFYKVGDAGGQLTTHFVSNLAKKDGYVNPVLSGETDIYGRQLGDMTDSKGERLTTKMLRSGLANITEFSDEGQVAASLMGRLERIQRKEEGKQTEWDIAGDLVRADKAGHLKEAKPVALDEQHLAQGMGYYAPGVVQVRSKDRNLDNTAKSSLSTAWALGLSNMAEGAWGAWDIIGDVFGFDGGGQANVERIKRETSRDPQLANQVAFDEEGNWTLDSASQVVDYVITNAAMSAPYMISSILSVAAAPFTYGASLAVPSVIYSGQTYNEQADDNKNAGVAVLSGIGQGILEYVGIKGVQGAAKNFLKDPAVRKQVVKELAKAKYKGNEVLAEQELAKATIKSLVGVSNAAKASLASHYSGKYLMMNADTGAAILKGTASEALTETGQELIGAIGEANLDFDRIDKGELINRLMNAAVAGGALGGIMSAGGSAKLELGQRGALEAHTADANLDKASEDYKWKTKLKAEGVETNNLKFAADTNQEHSLETLGESEIKTRSKRGFIGNAIAGIKERGFRGHWAGWMNHLDHKYANNSPALKKMFSMVGGNKVGDGANAEEYQQLTTAGYQGIIGTQEEARKAFGARKLADIDNVINSHDTREFFKKIVQAMKYSNFRSVKQAFQANNMHIPDSIKVDKDVYLEYLDRIYKFNEEASIARGRDYNLLEERAFNKFKIARDKTGFINALKKNGYSQSDAESIFNDIMDIQEVTSSQDLFDTNLFNMDRTADNLDISKFQQDPELSKYISNDFFYNVAGAAGTTAAFDTNSRFFGKDGSRLAYYINQALNVEGSIDEETAAFLAAEMKDFMDIRAGTYNRIENPIARSFLQNGLFLTTLNQLSLAPLSSLVELGLITHNINESVMFDKGMIKDTAKAAAREFYEYYGNGVRRATGGRVQGPDTINNKHGQMLFELGFLQESQSVAQKHDINTGAAYQTYINSFFQITGLQNLTNFNRAVRAALAGDAIIGWVRDIQGEGKTPTKYTMEARENLIELGIDIDFMVDTMNDGGMPIDQKTQEKFNEMMKLATLRFVNQAVAHPTKGNRPKFYQNPRTAIFFQFQGFLSSFTSNILPKVYKNLLGPNSTMDTRMSTIGTMATLIAIAFFSNFLRDLVKYGEETPYLDDWGQFRRVMNSSGLMGTGERVLNTVFPMYDQRSDGWLDAALDEISGQAPVLGYGGKLLDVGASIWEGKDNVGSRIQRAAPVTGPINQLGWAIDELFE